MVGQLILGIIGALLFTLVLPIAVLLFFEMFE